MFSVDPTPTPVTGDLVVDERCSTCGADLVETWTTANNKRMLVEPRPHPNGNLRVERNLLGVLTSTVVAPGSESVLYLPHWATCPDANHHRKRTRA